MAGIGIIANPASGKDIRRLVSYATTIDNQEKVNIVKRIVLAAQSMGVEEIYIMPDTFQIGLNVIDDLETNQILSADVKLVDMNMTATADDSRLAAQKMEELGLGCIVVLGGDGTSRAVAKGITDTPLLPISTGTNNVYPLMTEGTVAGMAAAAAALVPDREKYCIKDKRIDISVNGEMRDIALIDAVVSDDMWVGSKAIWDPDKLRFICVTRSHPASIGFSSAGGCIRIVQDYDDFGLSLELGQGGEKIIAPIAAGVFSELEVKNITEIPIGDSISIDIEKNCMIAVDGEREVKCAAGDHVTFEITKNGPLRVNIRRAVEEAMSCGLFKVK